MLIYFIELRSEIVTTFAVQVHSCRPETHHLPSELNYYIYVVQKNIRHMRAFLSVLLFHLALAQYVPEKYGWACYTIAAKRNWTQCVNVPKAQRKSCLCAIPEFGIMTDNCLKEAVKNESHPEIAIESARKLSLCEISTGEIEEENEIQKPYKNKSPGLDKSPEYQYIDPIFEDELRAAILTGQWRMSNDGISENSGLALIGFWMGLLAIRYISHIIMRSIPFRVYAKFVSLKLVKLARAKILNPPLGRQFHSQPLEYFLGIHVPTRAFSIIIMLFLILNYCLIFTNYPYQPHNFMFTTPRQQWSKSLAIRASFMTMWKLPLIFFFAGNNNFLQIIGHPWSLDTFNTFHRWIARITVVDIIIHGVAISIVKADQGLYSYIWNVPYWRWGIVGIIIATFLVLHSIRWFTCRYYELFKVVHLISAIVFIVSAWYHVQILPYGTKHIYSIVAIWVFDHIVRISRILLVCKAHATIEHVNPSMSVISICAPNFYLQATKNSSRFLFLHVEPWYKFLQSHPFTIVHDWQNIKADNQSSSCSKQTDGSAELSYPCSISKSDRKIHTKRIFDERLVVAIQHRKGITDSIARLPEGKVRVALDGPYGNHFPLSKFQKIVFIAGGIGITAHLGHIQVLLSKQVELSSKIKLHWAVKSIEDIEWLMDAISYLSSRIEVTLYFQGHIDASKWHNFPIIFKNSRLNCKGMVTKEINDEQNHDKCIAFFSCGPGSLNDEARVAVCWGIQHSRNYVEYFEESFGS